MKRSEINRHIEEAMLFFNKMNFKLPPWSDWTIPDWKREAGNCQEIFSHQLGWDLTDFGSGDYNSTGLPLFTLRNGHPDDGHKTYAEKIMIVGENQVTPMHFHWKKTEDIINRGGGNLCFDLYPSNDQDEPGTQPFSISMDGRSCNLNAGDKIVLHPGESITLQQGLYHRFYGEPGAGKVLVGEVSSVNDDQSDNRFAEEVGRFPEIEEDEEPAFLLVSDYKKYL